jgi:peptide-methionine (S)-S-oxide reductase
MFMYSHKSRMPAPAEALPGRAEEMPVTNRHFVHGHPIKPPYPENMMTAMFGMGCFWGVERKFWQLDGVYTTAVGYAGGYTVNPTYQEVCTGKTGHNEVVRVIYNPAVVSYDQLLKLFWEGHDPTQGMRQGNDAGTQYRSGIYTYTREQQSAAETSRDRYQAALNQSGMSDITTEIIAAPDFYYAEDYHQQYLAKNPGGYCGVGGTGISCPV